MKLKLINLEKKCSNSISCTENIYVNDSETINYIYANMNKFGSETKTRISYNKQNVDNKYFKVSIITSLNNVYIYIYIYIYNFLLFFS